MKIITWNVNGIRSILKKGFFDFLKKHRPDFLLLQETRISMTQIPAELKNPPSYHAYWNCALRPGYSGVALFSRSKLSKTYDKIGSTKFDQEGRVLFVPLGSSWLYNVYFPNGTQGDKRLKYKLDFYKYFLKYLSQQKRSGKKIVVGGDFNTAHKEIDLKNPKQNEKNSGFMPVERNWIDRYIKAGWIDIYRKKYSDLRQYTWWSYRFRAREKNIGWRIDYFLLDESLVPHVRQVKILTDVYGSDHCPVLLEVKS